MMTGVARGRLLPLSSAPAVGERVEELVRVDNVVIEQILSAEQDEPTDYLQHWNEIVLVLAGSAVLEIDGERCELGTGEWALLPAQVVHRLISTSPGTNWLAVHACDPEQRQAAGAIEGGSPSSVR